MNRSGFDENPKTSEICSKAQLFVASKGGTSHALVCSAKVVVVPSTGSTSFPGLRAAMRALESIADRVVEMAETHLVYTGHARVADGWRTAAAVCVSGRVASELGVTRIHLPAFETMATKSGEPMFVAQDDEVLLLVKSERADLCYEVSREFLALAGAELRDVRRTMLFGYMGSRDLTGFIDSTRNFGSGLGGVQLVALLQRGTLDRNINNVVDVAKKRAIADAFDEPNDTGASFVFHGRFKHDMARFRQLSAAQKSEVIGRDIERIEICDMAYAKGRYENPMLDSEPDHSHMQRSAGAMARQAWPFVEGADEGLEFFAFSRDFNILDASLRSMAGLVPGTESDRLMAFSKGVACGLFFVPSRTQLARL